MDSKVCIKCGEEKKLDDYYIRKDSKDGFRSDCKICHNKYSSMNHRINRERYLKRQREYYQENREKILYHIRKWHKDNYEKVLESCRKWKQNNPILVKEYNRKWKQNNPILVKEYMREYRRNNINARLSSNLRTRIWYALKGIRKSATTIELLGCSIEELKAHLEKQFTEGMTWDNYGEWHIDHIKPCSSFDLADPEQQKKCANYNNLQPLWATDNQTKWAKENWSKGAKVI